MTERSKKTDMVGLVLLGGRSGRMGQAKAYLSYDACRPQWKVCEAILEPHCESIYFSVSPQLSPPLLVDEHRVINDIFRDPIGPLGGILSGFKKHPDKAIFVLAVDLPYFDQEAAEFLSCRRNANKRATAFASPQIEPLCAIYEPSIFRDLTVSWSQGVYCPRKILSALDVETLIPETKRWLTNINDREEFEILRPPKTVKICYFSQLKEQARVSYESIETFAKTVAELYCDRREKYSFVLEVNHLRFVKNEHFVESDEPVADGDEIVFIPPVSGG